MTRQKPTAKPAEGAPDAALPQAGGPASADSAGLVESTLAVMMRAAGQPGDMASAGVRFWSDLARIGPVAAARWLGAEAAPPVPVPDDKRFADRAWHDNPGFFALRQAYLAAGRLTRDLLAAGAGDPVADAKAELASGFVLDALAPTNFLVTNPAAVKRAMETGGASLVAGARNFLDDALHNGGRPRQVDTSSFAIGGNLAATPGQVVFRNDLMELIQYAPQTAKVHAVPMLASPPWINKYYIMDLAPGRSFIEWAVQHERTVFAISYRNPDASMRGVTLDDYLLRGPLAALEVIGEITGAPRIDIVGLCLGGALTGMLAAYLAGTGDDRLGSVTLLNTMLDYAEPGVLGAFTDPATVARLEREMAKQGYLEGSAMAGTFDLLRANDLIFSYVVSGWLMGQDPPAFDLLAWNADSTRMPAAMHSFYLHSLYMKNALATGELELAGQRLSLREVKSDTYVVGAVNDHIVPWASSYKATSLLGGDVRYILSSGGHIAGIVNPPGPKAWYEAAGQYPADSAAWRAAATRQPGSWWEDWTRWAAARAGG
ncbi:MAG: alpha/beta fold hydrolase, partial [Actinomycetota bacterium]|nr:alpha/beta fold hydrolase [Actinomycetota bacterium]